MGSNQDTAVEIMYFSGKYYGYSKDSCPHDTQANTSVWDVLNGKGFLRTRKDSTLVIHCEG